MSCSACPSLPVLTVAEKTLLEVSAGETAVALSAVSDTWCDGTGREGERREMGRGGEGNYFSYILCSSLLDKLLTVQGSA